MIEDYLKKFNTSFIVMPKHCNYMMPMIFGGQFLAEMDLCAASCVRRVLLENECDAAVTYKVEDVTFLAAAKMGNLVYLDAEIVEMRTKAVVVNVKGYRNKEKIGELEQLAEGRFVFLTMKDGKFHPHGLTL